MKRFLLLFMLTGALLLMPVAGNSQVETIVNLGLSLLGIKGGDKYGKARLLELKKILDKNKKSLMKLARIDESSQATETYTQAQLEIARSVEEILRSTEEFGAIQSRDGQIKFNDLVVFKQIQQEVNGYLSNYVPAQFLKKLEKVFSDGALRNYPLAEDNAAEIYKMFFGKAGLDGMQPATLTDLGSARGDETQHLLQFQTAAQKKKIVQALLYYKLADELYAQSITLSNSLKDERIGTALNLARRMRGSVMQRMSQSNIQELISDPGGLGGAFDLLSMGDIQGMLGNVGDMQGEFEKILNDINSQAQGSLAGLEGIGNPTEMGALPPDMGYFSDANSAQGLRFSTGERASLQKMAMDMSTQSVEYRQKGDAMMENALQKTPLQQVMELKRARGYMLDSYQHLDFSL
ncbi:MAG: hypothetical protein JWP57_281 [Spirosoma sp.]|nr:hypothetical protein [Spirosoma sp.]